MAIKKRLAEEDGIKGASTMSTFRIRNNTVKTSCLKKYTLPLLQSPT
jgi:hypothetical protein